eukprot:7388422-Pyramimonas_sp.AAC.1
MSLSDDAHQCQKITREDMQRPLATWPGGHALHNRYLCVRFRGGSPARGLRRALAAFPAPSLAA